MPSRFCPYAVSDSVPVVGEQAYEGDQSKQLCVYLYLTDDEVITTIRFEGKSFDPVEFIKKNRNVTEKESEDTSWIRDLIIDTLIFKTCKKKYTTRHSALIT